MVIITAGMIGVGKTTLTGLIAEHFGTKAFYEPVGDNSSAASDVYKRQTQNSMVSYYKFIFLIVVLI